MVPLISIRTPGTDLFASRITDVIHLPGRRGNPERLYPVVAIGPGFPGTFESYVTSLIASWTADSSPETEGLKDDLKCLGESQKGIPKGQALSRCFE